MTLHVGNCLDILPTLQAGSVQCCVTSPPYWGLRDYKTDGQLGMEATPEEYVARMVAVFREVRRVLRDDGVLWLNLGDTYAGGSFGDQGKGGQMENRSVAKQRCRELRKTARCTEGLKPKDLVGIPWRVAFALQADGWYLRSEVIWCLSGGTLLYTRTQKGEMPMTVKDVARLDPSTVQLWNGARWTQLLGMNKSQRRGDEIEIVLRSGERISCTPTHRFPTARGLLDAASVVMGDVLESCTLPEPEHPRDCALDEDAAWFAGLYIAEGSRSGHKIQITGHSKEVARWERVQAIAGKYGGSATVTVDGNNQAIRVFGKVLIAILDELVTGRTAHDKGFAPVVWRYSNRFVAAMVDGYLSGDGRADGNRWRLGFCRNYNLERDLRTACARLGYTLTLNLASVPYNGKQVPTFRGEIRKERSGHHNEMDRNEVVSIRKARCRHVYDLGVEDAPHLFALASGILTHNSKPNPMPESVTDRPTKAHEQVFLLTKSARYFYDAEAVKEDAIKGAAGSRFDTGKTGDRDGGDRTQPGFRETFGRNLRSVWTIATRPYSGAHFATFPPELAARCIKAGSRPGDTVLDPFMGAGTVAMVAESLNRKWIGIELNPEYVEIIKRRVSGPLFAEVIK